MTTTKTELTCTCGKVGLCTERRPILSCECLCRDCQQAGALLEALPDARRVLDENKATRFQVYRKDRVSCLRGREFLREHRLRPESRTRRVVAMCCNTPMFLEFTQGHWLSIYGHLWPADALPSPELRTMTRDAPAGIALPDDVPNLRTHNLKFFARLIGAWAAMGFRTPKVDYVEGVLHVA